MSRHSLPVLSSLLVSIVAAWPLAIHAQPGAGAKFGGRDPRTCPDHSAPRRGPITPALAAQYVSCEAESVTGNRLILVDNVKVQVGAGRPFQPRTDVATDIDPSQSVYPIRGSFVRYGCDVPFTTRATGPYPAESTVGKNCRLTDQPNASGTCYRTTFGDWHCFLQDFDHATTTLRTETAPPH